MTWLVVSVYLSIAVIVGVIALTIAVEVAETRRHERNIRGMRDHVNKYHREEP